MTEENIDEIRHLLCGVGGEYICKKCRFLKECKESGKQKKWIGHV